MNVRVPANSMVATETKPPIGHLHTNSTQSNKAPTTQQNPDLIVNMLLKCIQKQNKEEARGRWETHHSEWMRVIARTGNSGWGGDGRKKRCPSKMWEGFFRVKFGLRLRALSPFFLSSGPTKNKKKYFLVFIIYIYKLQLQ